MIMMWMDSPGGKVEIRVCVYSIHMYVYMTVCVFLCEVKLVCVTFFSSLLAQK